MKKIKTKNLDNGNNNIRWNLRTLRTRHNAIFVHKNENKNKEDTQLRPIYKRLKHRPSENGTILNRKICETSISIPIMKLHFSVAT